MKQSRALVVCTLVVLATATQDFKTHKDISKLGPNYVLNYVSLLQDSLPVIHSSSDCFTYYMPLLSTLASETEVKSEACNTTAATDFASSMTNVQNENQELSENTNSIVASIQKCSSITDSIQQLECYSSFVSILIVLECLYFQIFVIKRTKKLFINCSKSPIMLAFPSELTTKTSLR